MDIMILWVWAAVVASVVFKFLFPTLGTAHFKRVIAELTKDGPPIVYGVNRAVGCLMFTTHYSYKRRCLDHHGRVVVPREQSLVIRPRAKEETMVILLEQMTSVPRKYWVGERDEAIRRLFYGVCDLSISGSPDTEHVSDHLCELFVERVKDSIIAHVGLTNV